ncbi:MAG TPA: IclR family transcriptional regulator [Gaiellaceae bacterium]|jgi:DNA-binding IclR family transcriptional regulator
MSGPTRIRSVARAARILLLVGEDADGLTARETALALRLPAATTHHLLGTLVAEGLLAKDSRRRYHLGPAVGALADTFLHRLGPPEHQVVALRRLADETGETAYLSGWRRGEIVVLASVEGSNAVRVSGLHVGFARHAHARAGGKLMLALARESVLAAYLAAHPLERLTERTITDEAAFRRELERIRKRRHAFDDGEFQEGVTCVAAPVVELGVATAALGISTPATRFRQYRRDLVEATLAAAASIETPQAQTASVP